MLVLNIFMGNRMSKIYGHYRNCYRVNHTFRSQQNHLILIAI